VVSQSFGGARFVCLPLSAYRICHQPSAVVGATLLTRGKPLKPSILRGERHVYSLVMGSDQYTKSFLYQTRKLSENRKLPTDAEHDDLGIKMSS
jgi:hypothetical protein